MTMTLRSADPSFYERDVVHCREGDASFEAHRVSLSLFERAEAPLHPDGLLAALSPDENPEDTMFEGDR